MDNFASLKTIIDISNLNTIKIVNDNLRYESIAEFINTNIRNVIKIPESAVKAGNYSIISNGLINDAISLNYSRIESNLDFYKTTELENIINTNNLGFVKMIDNTVSNITTSIKDFNQGKQLWKIFLLLALFLYAIEIFMLRFVYKK